MKNLTGCQYTKKITSRANQDENLKAHIASCEQCRTTQFADAWMQKFAAHSVAPQNLPAPGFLVFKARLLERQSAARLAHRPIAFAWIVSVLVLALTIGWLVFKTQSPVEALMIETFRSLRSVATLLIFCAASAALICSAFAYFLRRTGELKK